MMPTAPSNASVSPLAALPPQVLGTGVQMQKTLAKAVECSGIGLHSGQRITLRMTPAAENTGIVFFRTDLLNGARTIKALWNNVIDTRMCTMIGNDHGGKVGTIEHLMAAISANGIDNMVIEINGAEVPVMDGSAASFVFLLDVAGTVEQAAPRKMIEILAPIEVEHDGKIARLAPAAEAQYSVTIDFDTAAIKSQTYDLTLSAEAFKNEVSRARTFCFFEEIDYLQKTGLARGGSLDNAIVIKDDAVMNQDGLRYTNEFARHKVLDAVGDLALAGMAIRGRFEGTRTGHDMNNRLLHALFANPTAWRVIDAPAPIDEAAFA